MPGYVPQTDDLIVLAIPPQSFAAFAHGRPAGAFRQATIVSVMAGVPTAAIIRRLDAPYVVRAMPNVASQVSQGMTVMYASAAVTAPKRAVAERALGSIGRVMVVADEDLLDVATALAGGGPAFVAYVAKTFTDFADKAGFTDEQARILTCQVLRGTADLLETTRQDPERVYRNAMTPGGATERGILALQQHGLHDNLLDALEQAGGRARELGGISR